MEPRALRIISDDEIVSALAEHHACRSKREIAAVRAILLQLFPPPVLGARPRMRCPDCGRDVAQCRDGRAWGHGCSGGTRYAEGKEGG